MNAKREFIGAVASREIVCATIYREDTWDELPTRVANLKKGFSADDYEEFLQKLDFEYSNGFGGQELFGTIWLENGQWLDRGEYDGSEWWRFHSYPEIPESLL